PLSETASSDFPSVVASIKDAPANRAEASRGPRVTSWGPSIVNCFGRFMFRGGNDRPRPDASGYRARFWWARALRALTDDPQIGFDQTAIDLIPAVTRA